MSSRPPKFSVVTPVHNPPGPVLEAMLASVRRQTFSRWEHCLVDDGSADPLVRLRLEEVSRADPRVKLRVRPASGGIVAATNDALAMASGEFIAFLDHDDELHRRALERIAEAIEQHPEADYLYTDEDKIDVHGRHSNPFLKPDWSPDRLRCQMYTCHLAVVRRSLLQRVGSMRAGFDGAQDWDLALRASEVARQIVHVPEILYHWRTLPTSVAAEGSGAKPYAFDAGLRAVSSHLQRTGVQATAEPIDGLPGLHRLRPALQDRPLVSIVIPTAGQTRLVGGREVELVVNAVQSIVQRSSYPSYEIVIVADGSVTASTRQRVEEAGQGRTRIVPFQHPFNFSAKVNLGARHAEGDHLLLLNDDIEVPVVDGGHGRGKEKTNDWIESMVVYSLQERVGAVGAKLFFADGRLQHMGVVATAGAPDHSYRMYPGDHVGYFSNTLLPCNYLAATAACLLTRRDCFEAVGGFGTDLPVNYNDVDYCLKLHELGYRTVVTPEAKLLHLESATRVPGPVQPEELALLRERWGQLLAADPYYHWRFVAGSADFVMPLYRANGTFLPDRGLRRDLILVGQYLSDGGPRLLITRVLSRLRGTSPTPPSS